MAPCPSLPRASRGLRGEAHRQVEHELSSAEGNGHPQEWSPLCRIKVVSGSSNKTPRGPLWSWVAHGYRRLSIQTSQRAGQIVGRAHHAMVPSGWSDTTLDIAGKVFS